MPWAYAENPEAQPRKYNGKEWVEAFGYDNYLYGARDYYSAIGRFTVVDPFAEKYAHISPYAYCANNPIKYVDPDGRWIESLWDAVNVAMGVESFVSNIHEGNVSDALVDGVGITLDVIATILPVAPGGAGTAIKTLRAADKVSGVIPKTRIATKYNYRRALQDATGKIGKGYEAHHTLPQKHRDQFEKLGINIDDPGNVVWRKTENHRAKNVVHTKAWDEFWDDVNKENRTIAVEDIYEFRDELENNIWGNQYDIPME